MKKKSIIITIRLLLLGHYYSLEFRSSSLISFFLFNSSNIYIYKHTHIEIEVHVFVFKTCLLVFCICISTAQEQTDDGQSVILWIDFVLL